MGAFSVYIIKSVVTIPRINTLLFQFILSKTLQIFTKVSILQLNSKELLSSKGQCGYLISEGSSLTHRSATVSDVRLDLAGIETNIKRTSVIGIGEADIVNYGFPAHRPGNNRISEWSRFMICFSIPPD